MSTDTRSISLSALASLADAPPPSSDLDAVVAGLAWRDGLRIGAGVNAVTGAIGGVAIEPPAIVDATLKRSDARFRFIRTQSEMEQEIEVSAGGKYNIYGVDLSASSSYLSKVRYSELTVTLVAAYESRYADYDVASSYALTPQAKELIGDRARFRSLYGDYFVAGRRRGSRFIAVYTCRATSRTSLDTFSASFGGSAPNVFSAEGSTRFQKAASENHVTVDVWVGMEGFEGKQPRLPTTPAEVLDTLAWFTEHEKGVPLQALLQHYGTLDPAFSPRVDVPPLAFVELRTLYTLRWLVQERFASLPPVYADRFRRRVTELDAAVMANTHVLATDAAMRRELTNESSILLRELTDVLERQDFYFQVRECVGNEPAEGQRIDAEEGRQMVWLYGLSAYPRSAAVQIQSRVEHYAESWHIGWRERTLSFGPDQNFILVGWRVASNWTDGTNGGWWKATKRILLTSQGAVHVKSLYDRGTDWTVTYYFVNAADYQFGDRAAPAADAAASADAGLPYLALAAEPAPMAEVRVLEAATGRVLLAAEAGEHRSLRTGEQARVSAMLPADGSVARGQRYTLAFRAGGEERTLEEMELVEHRAEAGVLVFARSPSAAGGLRLPHLRVADGTETASADD